MSRRLVSKGCRGRVVRLANPPAIINEQGDFTMENVKKSKPRTIRSIQFLPDKVIVDQGEHRLFQFCRECKNGKHVKSFLNDAFPQVNLQLIDEATAIYLERKFYYQLSRGAMRKVFRFEAKDFANYAERRCALIQRRQRKSVNKALAS